MMSRIITHPNCVLIIFSLSWGIFFIPISNYNFRPALTESLNKQDGIKIYRPYQAQQAQASTDKNLSLEIKSFEYETATLNDKGEIVDTQKRQASFFEEELVSGVKLEMVLIPAGSFAMGSTDEEINVYKYAAYENPRHRVEVPGFFLGKFEVTQAQWRAVAVLPQIKRKLPSNPSRFKGETRPVEQVSWEECQEFCDRLSQKTGRIYRMPSEAEWEYGCRAGTNSPFHFGATITTDVANFGGAFPYAKEPKGSYRGKTLPVGSFKYSNMFGLYDMHGNVDEYTSDPNHGSYFNAPTDGTVWTQGGDWERRMCRGGSFTDRAADCRSASRTIFPPNQKTAIQGFRVAMSIPSRH